MSKLLFGCGYLGSRIASRWIHDGEQVHVLTRSARRASALRADGMLPIVGDVTDPDSLTALPAASTVLFAVGHDRQSGKTMDEVYVTGLANVLDALPADRIDRFLYVSSTSVYGQSDGSWVDEASPCNPVRDGGRICLAAEQTLARHPLGQRAVTLRLAGIYGPGRVPRRDDIRTGDPIPAPQGNLNLIHVDDAARAILAAERVAKVPNTFVVSDGYPVERREYLREVARLVGIDQPTFRDVDPLSAKAQRAMSDKKVHNRRMLSELRMHLAYPSYRSGLQSILSGPD